MARQVLVYSPTGSPGVRLALAARGWSVVVAANPAELSRAIATHTVELVVLDDPPWSEARDVVTLLDASPALAPRLWVSSWPEAPAHSGKLGVDALLLDPADVDGIAEQAARIFEPRPRRASTTPLFASGSSPSIRARHPRLDRDDE